MSTTRRTGPAKGRWAVLGCALALMLAHPTPASAHKLKVFAYVEGTTIRGTVYFAGDIKAKGALVTALAPDGTELARMHSAEDGSFSLEAKERSDLRLVADAGDGHQATFVVHAVELPPTLPGRNSASAGGAVAPAAAAVVTAGEQPPSPLSSGTDIEAMIDRAVGRHVGPLAERLAAFEDTVRWHDVLGGIGYIFGLTGVGFYVATRNRGRGGG